MLYSLRQLRIGGKIINGSFRLFFFLETGQKPSRLTVVCTIDFMSQGNVSANRPAVSVQQAPVVPDVPAVMDVNLCIARKYRVIDKGERWLLSNISPSRR